MLGKKNRNFIALSFFLLGIGLSAQTVTQIGFIVNKALPATDSIAVFYAAGDQARVEQEAKTAVQILKKKVTIYAINQRSDISRYLSNITNLSNAVVVVIGDNQSLDGKTTKFLTQKLLSSKTPVVSTIPDDTQNEALLTISKKDDALEKHVNKKVIAALELTLSDSFLGECIIDTP